MIAFFATTLYSTATLRSVSERDAQLDSYRLAIAFGATNAVASSIPFFLVDKKTEDVDKSHIPKTGAHGLFRGFLGFGSKVRPNDQTTDPVGLCGEPTASSSAEHAPPHISSRATSRASDGLQCGDRSQSNSATSEIPNRSLGITEMATHQTENSAHSMDRGQEDTFRATQEESVTGNEANITNDTGGDCRLNGPLPMVPTDVQEEPRRSNQSPANSSGSSEADSTSKSSTIGSNNDDEDNSEPQHVNEVENDGEFEWRGRRFLLLTSMLGCMIFLIITALCFHVSVDSPARLPLIALFTMLFTFSYSIGAGAIPFMYCAEIFPNEGREAAMSVCVAVNFLGAGILATFVPFGINWGQDGNTYGHGRLLGLFAGLNCVGVILVWFLVPSTNETISLEEMNYAFGQSLWDHIKVKRERLPCLSKALGKWLLCHIKVQGKRVLRTGPIRKARDEETGGVESSMNEKSIKNTSLSNVTRWKLQFETGKINETQAASAEQSDPTAAQHQAENEEQRLSSDEGRGQGEELDNETSQPAAEHEGEPSTNPTMEDTGNAVEQAPQVSPSSSAQWQEIEDEIVPAPISQRSGK